LLQNNLNRLLGERNIKISDLARKTGLAKNTISAMSRGLTGCVQYDTLEKICSFLQITPAEFFDYSPYVLETKSQFDLINLKTNNFQYVANVTNSVYDKDFILDVTLFDPLNNNEFPRTNKESFVLYVKVDLSKDPDYSPEELFGIIDTLSPILKRKFYQQLVADIILQLDKCAKKETKLPVSDSQSGKISDIELTKHQHCVIDIFKDTPCHRLIDLEIGTEDITL